MKFIKDYEELYLIGENGVIYSLPKNGSSNEIKKLKTRINKYGYEQCILMKNNKTKTCLVHRLVAQTYIPNPNNYPQVNHINGIKSDNRIYNLEWCSVSKNTKHAFDNNLSNFRDNCLRNLREYNQKNKYIKVVLEKDEEQIVFNSTAEAGKFLGTRPDNISRAYKKKQRCKGYNVVVCEKAANGEA